jgi:hypothetical protein
MVVQEVEVMVVQPKEVQETLQAHLQVKEIMVVLYLWFIMEGGGGGGGAGAVGGNGTDSWRVNGGNGTASSITGSSVTRCRWWWRWNRWWFWNSGTGGTGGGGNGGGRMVWNIWYS